MSSPPQVPSIYAAILFQSRMNPHAVAVSSDSGNVTYRAFCSHIEKVTRRLAALELPASSRVAVHIQTEYLKWLANISLARLGLVTASVTSAEPTGELALLRADVVLVDKPYEAAGRKVIQLGDDWLGNAADALPAFQDRLHDPEAPCRIILSSGTTGLPKKALFTYGNIRTRNRGPARVYGINATARVMTTMGTSTIGGFTLPIVCWSSGGTVLIPSLKPGRPVAQLLRNSPNVLVMSTAQLEALAASLPPSFWPSQHLVIYVAGSVLPQALSRKVRLRLTQSLFIIYGSTEAGSVSVAHASAADGKPGFTGYVLPTAQVEIIDAQGRPVPPGTTGEVRMRAEGLIDSYLEDVDASDQPLRDGWFYPGDAGSLGADGALYILGRTRELMNLGGAKVAPHLVEEALAGLAGVVDLAVFALAGANGDKPAIAVVPSAAFDDQRLLDRYKKAFPQYATPTIHRVDAIPRNEMGKVMRARLSSQLAGA